MKFWLVLSALLIFGLAVRQIAYILLNGSIFDGLRNSIQRRARCGSRLFRKLNDLFSCNVCMTAQVSIWFVGVPTMALLTFLSPSVLFLLALAPFFMIPILLLGAFLIAMAVAATAIFFWNLIEYRRKKFDAMEEDYRKQISELRGLMAAQQRELARESGESAEAELVETN